MKSVQASPPGVRLEFPAERPLRVPLEEDEMNATIPRFLVLLALTLVHSAAGASPENRGNVSDLRQESTEHLPAHAHLNSAYVVACLTA